MRPADLAAAGPRSAGRESQLRDAVAAAHDGYERHYGPGQAPDAPDRDLALLDCDRRYAEGLARLAAIGDLAAIAELADAISLCAQAHAEKRPDVADAVWALSATAIGWGATPQLARAKARARAGDPAAPDVLRDAVSNVRRPSPHG
jgi:hypothetical protein